MPNLFHISSISIIVSSSIIAVFLLLKSKKNKSSTILSVFCFFVALWGIGGYEFSIATSKNSALLGWQIAYLSVIMSPVLYSHFVFSFLRINKKRLIIFLYALSIFFLTFNIFFPKLLFGDLRFVFGEFWIIDPLKNKNIIFFIFYIIYYWFILSYGFWILIKHYQKSTGLN